MSMEQANRTPSRFFAGKDKRSVVLPAHSIFGEDGTQVTSEGTIELSRLAALLKLQGSRRVRLEVHADSHGDAVAEQARTELQAHAVRTWLAQTGGVDTARLQVAALGSRRPHSTPPASSDVPAIDARVELHVVDPPAR
jgi:outer membrane protein OmpA-like peptidoglycan-associated protein